MPIPPNGCVYVGGEFAPAQFDDAFDLGSLVCGPYFTQSQGLFFEVQAQAIYQPVLAQQVYVETQAQEA